MPLLSIARGVTRTVILTPRYAIKVPTLRGTGSGRSVRNRLAGIAHGLLANQSEHAWHDFEGWCGKRGPYVTPVLRSWLGGFVQVYPRCAPLPAEVCLPPQLEPSPGDLKPDNFGVLAGQVVWLDYVL